MRTLARALPSPPAAVGTRRRERSPCVAATFRLLSFLPCLLFKLQKHDFPVTLGVSIVGLVTKRFVELADGFL